MYYLDTNTCIYFLNGNYESVKVKILSTGPNEIAIPSIVKAELLFRAYKSINKKNNIEKIVKFLEPFEIVAFDDSMSQTYAEIRYKAEKIGEIVGPNDLFIAAIVKFREGTLVTNNDKEFRRIEGLKIENWVR
ncbi:MAG: PilT protein domain-containing protein [Spirochaetes bacterium]|nr:MAG: PilT protein domain-containing protein [Spirochaetota bacterium]